MRVFKYQMQFCMYEGYEISNADVYWGEIPQKVNFECPSIRITDDSIDGGAGINVKNCLTADILGNGVNKDYLYRNDVFFANHLPQLVRGELKKWKLIGINVSPLSVRLGFANKEFPNELYTAQIEPNDGNVVHTLIEVERKNGSVVKYRLTVNREYPQIHQNIIKEEESLGYKKFVFDYKKYCQHTSLYPEADYYPVEVIDTKE